MQYIISLMLLISSIIKKKSHIVMFLMFCFLWILYSFNTDNADYGNYILHYQGYYIGEPGFALICRIAFSLGLSYRIFICILSLTCLFVIINTIRRYTNNVAFVLGLYFIFPFLLDIVQIRNFIEMTIVIFSIRYLVENRKLNNFKYILAILIATTIHTSAIFYLIFLLAKYLSKKALIFSTIIIVPIGCILAYSNFINNIFIFLDLSIFKDWFQTKPRLGFLLMFAIQTYSFLILYIAYNKLNKKESITFKYKNRKLNNRGLILNKNNYNIITTNIYDVVFKINILLFTIFIFYMYNAIYFRLYRNILILNYCVIVQAITNTFKSKKNKNLYTIHVILWVFFLFLYMIIYSTDYVFSPIFNENIIFKIFSDLQ